MLIMWDVETGEMLRSLPDFTVFKVSFSPDGTRVAAATFNGLQVWMYTPGSAEPISLEESQAILTIPEVRVLGNSVQMGNRWLPSV